jgi:hypothetical protein
LLGSLCQHDFTVIYSSTLQSTPPYYDNLDYFLSTVHFSDHYMFATRANPWSAQVAIHRTVEVDLGMPRMDEEQPHGDYKQSTTMRSQAELDMIAAELQMKNDLQI